MMNGRGNRGGNNQVSEVRRAIQRNGGYFDEVGGPDLLMKSSSPPRSCFTRPADRASLIGRWIDVRKLLNLIPLV